MKKLILFIVLLLILPCLLVSCKDTKQNEDNASISPGAATTQTKTEVSPITTSHSHNYSEWVTVAEATCLKEGSRVRVCLCGQKETEAIEKLLHSYIEAVCIMCHQKHPNFFEKDYASGKANLVGTLDGMTDCTVQDRYIYFSKENVIYKVDMNGGDLQEVHRALVGSIHCVNVVEDWIYFFCEGSTQDRCYIAKVRTDGEYFEKLVLSVNISEMLVVKDIIYYVSFPLDRKYQNYSKEWFPLYSIATCGGMPTQIHDGAVRGLVSDGTYLYYVHSTREDTRTVCRTPYGGSQKKVLLENTDVLNLALANSKLYILSKDKFNDHFNNLASMETNGKNYTTITQCWFSSTFLHVVGNKAYYDGSAPEDGTYYDPDEYGIMEYNMNTKKFKSISWDYAAEAFSEGFIWLVYNKKDTLAWITIYYSKTGELKKIEFN